MDKSLTVSFFIVESRGGGGGGGAIVTRIDMNTGVLFGEVCQTNMSIKYLSECKIISEKN